MGVLIRLLIAFALLLATAPPVSAADWNILVVGDINSDTPPATDPAWRSADRAITQALIDLGFDVFDKPTLGLAPDCRGESCEGYSQQDFVRMARELNRTADEPVDLMVVYSVTFTQRDGAAIDRYQVRLPGRMVDIETGRIVDQWAGLMQEHNDPSANCTGPCLRLWKADRARESGAELGAVLAEKLAAYVRTYTFRIFLREFTPPERDRILSGLRQAPDYQSGSLEEIGLGNRTREWLHQRVSGTYELTTPLRIGPLRSRLERLVEQAGASASVLVQGSRLEVTREGFPYRGRYTAAFLAPFLLLLLFLVWQRYARFDQEATELARKDVPSEGLSFLEQRPIPGLPRRPRWEALRQQWRDRVEQADRLVEQARAALKRRDFDAAEQALSEALEHDAGHTAALAERERLEWLRRADTLASEAETLIESDPSTASKKLTEAIELDEGKAGQWRELLETAEARLRDTVLDDGLREAQAALEANQPYRALSHSGRALFAIEGLDGFEAEFEQLSNLRDRAVEAIEPLCGDARAKSGLPATRFLTGEEIGIGRARGEVGGAITMNYMRASRVGKQAVIRREGRRLFLIDRGSTHGTLADEILLENGQPKRLLGDTLVALGGGREPPRPGAARLRISVSEDHPDSAIVSFDLFHLKLLDADDLSKVWPTMHEDMKRQWLVLRGGVTIHHDGQGLKAGAPDADQPALILGYEHGYWVEPAPGKLDDRVQINGEVLTTRIPLAATARVDVAGTSLQLEQIE
ncbi:MAG: hypothetical protein U5L08_16460 [Xanthomonadales bacterium]|nr:hypothetical protein [Xanthomonadales bacterium]